MEVVLQRQAEERDIFPRMSFELRHRDNFPHSICLTECHCRIFTPTDGVLIVLRDVTGGDAESAPVGDEEAGSDDPYNA